MQSKLARRIAFVALLAGIAVVVRVETTETSRVATSRDARPTAERAAPLDTTSALAGQSAATHVRAATPSATQAPPMTQPPVRLAVRAPSDVRVGDAFEARVDIDASAAVRDLMFSVTYEKSRLNLVGRSEGDFVRQPGVVADCIEVPNAMSFDGSGDVNPSLARADAGRVEIH